MILVAVALTVGTTAAVVMLVIQLIYQQVENYIVYPIVYQRAVELSAFTTIVAVLIAGAMLGVVGAILAVPFAAVIKIVIREASAPRRARMEALRAEELRQQVPVDGDHSGPPTAPASRSAATSSKPQSAQNLVGVLAGLGGGRESAAGVRLKRGAGAGWSTPPASTNVPRAARCGCCGASSASSTGACTPPRPPAAPPTRRACGC